MSIVSPGQALDPNAWSRQQISSSTTETVDISRCPRIEITASGNTLSVKNQRDNYELVIANISTGDAYLNFSIILQGTTFSAPVTMPAGDVYCLIWDQAQTAFRF
jgi:hypothetical protein